MKYLATLLAALVLLSACQLHPVQSEADFAAMQTATAAVPPVTIEPQVVPPTEEATATVELVPTVTSTPECLIKGNVSSTGELIFHVPGGASYAQTDIDPARTNAAGVHEQYFCDEQSALDAGFRKSSR